MVARMKLIRRTRERGSSLTKSNHQDLPSGQVIKTLPPPNAGGTGSISSQGPEIHMLHCVAKK